MSDRFILFRGTPDGPAYLADPDLREWTVDRDAVDKFVTYIAADAVRRIIVSEDGIAVAIVSVEIA